MFDFTKEVIINDLKSFKAYDEGARGIKFRVHGGGDYFGKYVVDATAYKTEAQHGALAVLAIDAEAMVAALQSADKHFTLNIELGLDGDARADWGSYVYYFKKPMLVDGFAASWDNAGDGLGNLLKAVLTDYKFVHVLHGAKDGEFAEELGIKPEDYNDSKVYVVGGDYNVKIRKITLMEYVCEARCEGQSEEPSVVFSCRPDMTPDYMEYTPNVVEFGTYNYLLQNLRLPTYENYRFTSPAAVEMPVAGADYVQYTFMYCVPRHGLGGLSVAGQFNHSMTTHVFFVKSDIAADFESALGQIGVSPVSIERKPSVDAGSHAVEILPDSFSVKTEE